jgi:uncharacterized protein (TIGR02145 family)
LQITTWKPENIVVRIFDIGGREIISKKYPVIQGIQAVQLKNLPTGIFIVQVSSQSKSEQIKLISYNNSNSQPEIGSIYPEQVKEPGLITKSAADARLLGYEVYDNIVVRVWPTNAPWELSRGFVMTDEEPLPEEKHTFVFEYVKCEDKCGNVYNTVQIGNQIWMAENLKCPTEKSWIYDNNPNNIENYGLLYTWEDALNNAPVGWHLPTHEEWLEMEENVRITYNDKVPLALKSKVGWLPDENQNSTNGNDASGFNIVPGGARWFYDGSFYASGESAYFWTATKKDSIRATIRKITKSDTTIGAGYSNIDYGFSVRYVKDKTIEEGEVLISGTLDETLLSLLNAENLQIMSMLDSSYVSATGEFEVLNYQNVDEEQIPIFFSENGNFMFGYNPKTTNANIITLDDILYFYFSLFPDIRLKEFQEEDLMNLIINDENYSTLSSLLIESFKNQLSPVDNERFVSTIHESANYIALLLAQNTKSANISLDGDFSFNFDRKGNISWNEDIPLFAAMGFEIRNNNTNELVYGPEMLNPRKVILSVGSIINWGFNKIFSMVKKNPPKSTNLPKEGNYSITLTNGKNEIGNEDNLHSSVYKYNQTIFLADLIAIIIPKNIAEKLMGDCGSAIYSFFTDNTKNFLTQIFLKEKVTPAFVADELKIILLNFIGIVQDCSNGTDYLKTLTKILDGMNVLSKAESVSNLITLAHDFFGSEITGIDTINFYDGFSFGKLEYERLQDNKIFGPKESEHQYKAVIREHKPWYYFDYGLLSTTMIKKDSLSFANGIPFNVAVLDGDTTVIDEKTFPIISMNEGNLKVQFKMGSKDSRVIIEPAFKNSELKSDTISLNVTEDGTDTGTFTDSRDGKVYKTVTIGNQTWMAENLAYLPTVNKPKDDSKSSAYFYVYGYYADNEGNVSVSDAKALASYTQYGVLYNWTAALTACPSGWHLPSYDEWIELQNFLGGIMSAGGKMKESGTTYWNSPNTNATNSSSFSGMPGGYRSGTGSFQFIGESGMWWTSTEESGFPDYAKYFGLWYNQTILDRAFDWKGTALSIRCIKD